MVQGSYINMIRDAVSTARVKDWSENDDYGQKFMEGVSMYGEVGVYRAGLKKLNDILQNMIVGWDIDTQEEMCVNIERDLKTATGRALKGSYRARRVT